MPMLNMEIMEMEHGSWNTFFLWVSEESSASGLATMDCDSLVAVPGGHGDCLVAGGEGSGNAVPPPSVPVPKEFPPGMCECEACGNAAHYRAKACKAELLSPESCNMMSET